MPSWRSHINLRSCLWFGDGSRKRRVVVCMVAGALYSIGWWLMIDALVTYPVAKHIGVSLLLGFLGTMSMIIVNTITQKHINSEPLYERGCIRGNAAMCWVFVGFVLHCNVLFASFALWVIPVRKNNQGEETKDEKQLRHAAAIKIITQNFLIFFSSIIYKFFRPADESVI